MSGNPPVPRNRVNITAVTNPWKPNDGRIFTFVQLTDDRPAISVREAVKTVWPTAPADYDIEAAVDGRVLTPEERDNFVLHGGHWVTFCAVPKGGGGGKNILRIVAMVAVIAVAPYAAGGVYGAYLGSVYGGGALAGFQAGLGLTFTSMAASALTIGMTIGGMMLVNALFPSVTPDMDLSGLQDLASASPTYGWNNAHGNLYREGSAYPVLYGTRRITPPCIARHVSVNENGDQVLNMLMLVADHPCDSIGSVYINDQPSTNYTDVTVTKNRLGTTDQDVIDEFLNTYTEQSVGAKIDTDWYEVVITANDAEELSIGLSCPHGLWYANDSGGLDSQSVTVEIQHARQLSADPETWDGWVAWDDVVISGASQTAIFKAPRKTGLASGTYKVRVRFKTAPSAGARYGTGTYLNFVQSARTDGFSYPYATLLSIKALATNQLSGSAPNIECVATRSTVPVHDGTGWTTKPADNHAWVVYDMLCDPEYGAGVACTRMIYSEFAAWAAAIDSLGLKCNVYFDTQMEVSEALALVYCAARGRAIFRGSHIGAIYDTAVSAPTMLFNRENIIEDTWERAWLNQDERINVYEITFWDEDREYSRQTILLRSHDYDSAEVERKKSLALFTETTLAGAIRIGRYLLNCNRYLDQVVSFEAFADALACQIGDVIAVSHRWPQWGESARIVSSSNDGAAGTATLNREITFESGETYEVFVKHQDDDAFETHTLVNPGTTTNEITLSGGTAWTKLPAKNAIVSVGKTSYVYKLFRITNITRGAEILRRKITAVEYNAEVYSATSDSITVESPPDYTYVTGLVAAEGVEEVGGNRQSYVGLTWAGSAMGWQVFYRENATTAWVKAGETTVPSFRVRWLKLNTDYDFVVCVGNNPNTTKAGRREIVVGFTHTGIDAIESDYSIWPVSGLEVLGGGTSWGTPDLHLVWNHFSSSWIETEHETLEADFNAYRIEICETGGTVRRTEYVSKPEFTYTREMNRNDGAARQLLIKVYGRSKIGDEADSPATISVSNSAPAFGAGLTLTPLYYGIKVAWPAIDDMDLEHYAVYLDKTADPVTQVATVGPGTNLWVELDLDAGDEYHARVVPYDSFGAGTAATAGPVAPLERMATVELSEGITMIDADGNPASTLEKLYDGNRTGDGVRYDGSGKWIEYGFVQNWKLDRVVIWLGAAAGAYLVCSTDASAWNYLKYSGGAFVAAADEADAMAHPWSLSAGKNEAALPADLVARYVRILFTGTLAADIHELIFVREILAEKVMASELSALSADLGTIVSGILQSANLSATEGTLIDLVNNVIKMGGTADPRLHFDGSKVTIALADNGKIRVGENGTIEIASGGVVTVGDSNVVIDSANQEVIVSVDGGKDGTPAAAGPHYLRLKNGGISYGFFNGTETIEIPSLRRSEEDTVVIPAAGYRDVATAYPYATQPRVVVIPTEMPLYDKDYAAYDQKLICRAGNFSQNADKSWNFRITANLSLGTANVTGNASSSRSFYWSPGGPTNAVTATLTFDPSDYLPAGVTWTGLTGFSMTVTFWRYDQYGFPCQITARSYPTGGSASWTTLAGSACGVIGTGEANQVTWNGGSVTGTGTFVFEARNAWSGGAACWYGAATPQGVYVEFTVSAVIDSGGGSVPIDVGQAHYVVIG